jgi:hypothetical protein
MDSGFWDKTEGTGYLKAGFLGFPKSGKTYTAVMLALAARERLGLKGPISMFDTEGGSVYIRHIIEEKTGTPPLVKRARSFDDLMAWGKACLEAGVSVGIVDSITHPWIEIVDSYLQQKNEALAAAGKAKVKRLEFSDWNVIKPTWGLWTSFYLNSKLSLIVCGRAGWEWNFEENEETGKKELRKTGVKMKTEGDFGFEPSLLVEMEREQDRDGDAPRITRRATVLGDRFKILDGKTFVFGGDGTVDDDLATVSEVFAPHLALLAPGAHSPISTSGRTEFGVDERGDTEFYRERREREILAEEIQADMVSAFPGQSAAEKKSKVDLLKVAFGTGSWTKVESMDAATLRAGRDKLREEILKLRAEPAAAAAEKEAVNA